MMSEQDIKIKIEKEQAVLDALDLCLNVMESVESYVQLDCRSSYRDERNKIRVYRNQYAVSIDSLTAVLEGGK